VRGFIGSCSGMGLATAECSRAILFMRNLVEEVFLTGI
jgi:hypothetical protein